ncbi:hypothetical protein [Cryptosporangium japonicum]|uniref:Uncharacterized protein n=1 Tax=Cryptosporangium japonicum TaxID=80872 RepID=A0ABP3EWZ5_9ACTN
MFGALPGPSNTAGPVRDGLDGGAEYSTELHRQEEAEPYRAGDAEGATVVRASEVPVAPVAPVRLVPGTDPVGAAATVLALAGVGLARPGWFSDRRRPAWDLREIGLLLVAVLLVWLAGWVWPVALGLAAVALWLARVGPPDVRPRWLAGATLGGLAAALLLAAAGWAGAPPDHRTLLTPALLAAAFVLVATAPLGTAARRVGRASFDR